MNRYFPEEASKLFSSKGKDIVLETGIDIIRGVILNILSGRNLRDSTELLTRRRIMLLNAATLVMMIRGTTGTAVAQRKPGIHLRDVHQLGTFRQSAGIRRRLGRGVAPVRRTACHPFTAIPSQGNGLWVDLMRYLCKLTRTPTGGVVLDPFMGSGTTGIAALLEHRDFIGIELNAEYAEIARKRIADMEGPLFSS